MTNQVNCPVATSTVVLLPGEKVIPVKRKDWFERIATLIMPLPEPVLRVSSLMIVASSIVGLSLPAPLIVVAPCSVIPFVISKREVQLNVPAGTVIVSPSCAALCKACTFAADPSES